MAKFNLKKAILENKATFFSSLTEGQFSWFTQDTDEQIGSDPENTITVYMHDNKGNVWKEDNYEGYGEFGGKDYYELLAQMNNVENADRSDGIDLAFSGRKVLFPALTASPKLSPSHNFFEEAENDPNQSWYTPEDNNDDYITGDKDDEYLDESKIEEGLTPLQQHVYDFESEVSGEDFAEKEKENIMNLKTVSDVKNYYSDYRGWMDDNSLREMLMDLLIDLVSKFPTLKEGDTEFQRVDKGKKNKVAKDKGEEDVYGAGVKKGEEIEKKKMKVSELKAKIREMILAEDKTEFDIEDSAKENSLYDPVSEAEEETDTETADTEIETPEGTEDIEVTDTTTTAEVDPNVKSVQDALTQAQAAAEQLGDKKLMDQIGNTITFFTRTHVVEKPGLAEVSIEETLLLQKRAGIITENQYKAKLAENK